MPDRVPLRNRPQFRSAFPNFFLDSHLKSYYIHDVGSFLFVRSYPILSPLYESTDAALAPTIGKTINRGVSDALSLR
jgi:hypothetical protein